MASEDFVCATLANLKVLASVPNSGRICVRKGQLAVDTTVHGQFLMRFVYGDSRENTLNHIRNAITNAISIAKTLMGDIRTPASWENIWTLERLCTEMERCSVGIRNLKSTYSDDFCMVANLDVQEERLAAHRLELRKFLGGDAAPPPHENPLSVSKDVIIDMRGCEH